MQKDPVCGMQVDPAKTAGSSEYNATTGNFCSASCTQKFDRGPKQYAN